MFTSGVEKISSQKGVEDATFWIAQIFEFIDPAEFSSALKISENELLKILTEHQSSAVFTPYLVRSAVHLKNHAFAKGLLAAGVHDISLLTILKKEHWEQYYDAFLSNHFAEFFTLIINEDYQVISPKLVHILLEYLHNESYSLNTNQYQLLALHLPEGMESALEQYYDKPLSNYKSQFFRSSIAEVLRVYNFKNSLEL